MNIWTCRIWSFQSSRTNCCTISVSELYPT